MISAAKLGLGYMCIHKGLVKVELECGDLIEVFPQHAVTNQNLFLYYQKNKYVEPKIRAFIDFFTK